MPEQPPLPVAPAATALARCALNTATLTARRSIHQPRRHVGLELHFADGHAPRVYRETVIDRPPTRDPTVLVVCFRLRAVRGRGHDLFRLESELNTPLFVGFPGFVSKLWLAHDASGQYRGLYEWDDADLAEDYVRALWWVLALVSHRDSIHYSITPGLRRDQLLHDPEAAGQDGVPAWARLTAAVRSIA
ncbi:hypothetical protein [Oryzihumus sp.]